MSRKITAEDRALADQYPNSLLAAQIRLHDAVSDLYEQAVRNEIQKVIDWLLPRPLLLCALFGAGLAAMGFAVWWGIGQ